MMKKVVSVILSAILVLSSGVMVASAADSQKVYPLVLLQGYGGPTLIDQDTGEQAWGLDFDLLKQRILDSGKTLASGAAEYIKGDSTLLVDTIGGIMNETLEPISCNDDGSSVHNLDCFPKGAAATRASTLIANGQENFIAESPIVDGFIEELKSQGIDNAEDYIFIFTGDWRKGQAEYAKDVDAYITEVKELTKSSKVNIYGLSHGGQYGAAYLYYFGEKGDVNKACLNVPAIGGTSMVGDPMLGNDITIDFPTILEFVEIGYRSEAEFEWILSYLSALTGGYQNLNKIVNEVAQKYIIDFIDKIGSLWDFIPLDVYDEVKERLIKDGYIDPVKNAKIIAQSDEFHYNAMAHMNEGLVRAQKAGTKIAIMSNTGKNGVTGTNKNSDYIIDVRTSSGAYCAPFGEQLPQDYECANTNCNNPAHYHISPAYDIDATCAYLPENTWFINGQFHGQSNWDNYSRQFILDFLFGDSITDIYSNPKYPQFELAQNPADGLYVRFNNTNSGFHTSADTELVLKNMSEQYDMKILDISVDGVQIDLSSKTIDKIAAGEAKEVGAVSQNIASQSRPFTITVKYLLESPQYLIKEKTFSFTPFSDAEALKYSFMNDAKAAPIAVNTDNNEEESTAPIIEDDNSNENATTVKSKNIGAVKSKNPNTGTEKMNIAAAVTAIIAVGGLAAAIVKIRKDREA